MTVLSLRMMGFHRHDRVLEATHMIFDRQLSSGGWNYGNTTVFKQELLPMPDQTGLALCALAGVAPRSSIQKSIDYAKNQIPSLTSPHSFCWCLFGLKAWGVEIVNIRECVLNSIALQEKVGFYDTTLLSKLIVTYETNGDLFRFLGIE
jgi:hypothetical protein